MSTNKVNGKEYIGQTVGCLEKRKQAHKCVSLYRDDDTYFHRSIKKYGMGNFDWEILHDGITNINDLNKLEIYYIKLYDTYSTGYNLTLGGKSTWGWCPSQETRDKIGNTNKGKVRTEKFKRGVSKRMGGENHPMWGKRHPEETKKKISESHKKIKKEDHAMYGKHHSEKSKKQIAIANGKAIIIEGQLFCSITEAFNILKIHRSTIRRRIKHKTKWLDYKYA